MNGRALAASLLLTSLTSLASADGRPPVVLLFGPPGVGKSTQSELLASSRRWPAISTGALLRAEVARATPLGKRVEDTMAHGGLVDDAIVNQLVAARIAAPDCARGFLLDGYPRAVAQAHYLDRLLAERGFAPPTVVYLDASDAVLIGRLAARGRGDDSPTVVRARLQTYRTETRPVLDLYRGRPHFHAIDGAQSRDEVFRAIEAALMRSDRAQPGAQ